MNTHIESPPGRRTEPKRSCRGTQIAERPPVNDRLAGRIVKPESRVRQRIILGVAFLRSVGKNVENRQRIGRRYRQCKSGAGRLLSQKHGAGRQAVPNAEATAYKTTAWQENLSRPDKDTLDGFQPRVFYNITNQSSRGCFTVCRIIVPIRLDSCPCWKSRRRGTNFAW